MQVAIYSRKSVFTNKGESIENQIEMCKEYYYRNYGNDVNFEIYEDEGFSGGNTKRPEFQRLLKDIKSKKFDALICYRLDRISRNVADFSATLELLQSNNVDFISIREQFDTSTPMGRAMVYISSVFAQLERETIAERVKDNMIELAKTGRWLGGICPLGFDSERIVYFDETFKEKSMSKLIPNDEELELVKEIYTLYLDLKSATQVAKRLSNKNFKGKHGGFLSAKRILEIIENSVYVISDESVHAYLKTSGVNVFGIPNGCGYLEYNRDDKDHKLAAISNHSGIIPSSDWIKAQKIRDTMKDSAIKSRLSISETILNGVIKCACCGSNMYAKRGKISPKTGAYNYYYICSKKEREFGKTCNNKNINARTLDNLVLKELETYDKKYLKSHLLKVVNEYKKSITTDNTIEIITQKENQISNLINRISLAPNNDIVNLIMNEITKMQQEVNELKSKLKTSTSESTEIDMDIMDIEILNNLLTNLKNNINYMDDYTAKRKLIQTVVKEVIWNGLDYTLDINLIGAKKK